MSWGYLCGNRGEQAETFPFNFVPFGTITFLFYYKHTLLLEFKKKFFSNYKECMFIVDNL